MRTSITASPRVLRPGKPSGRIAKRGKPAARHKSAAKGLTNGVVKAPKKPGVSAANGLVKRVGVAKAGAASRAAPAAAARPAPAAPQAPLGSRRLPLRHLAEFELPVTRSNAGDNHAIHQLLTAVFHAPSRDAFLASLDDPFYEPTDRVIVRCGQRIVSHAQVTKRVMHIGSLALPVAGLVGVATLPEFRNQGHAGRVLAAAEQEMIADGAVLGMLRTRSPRFFRTAGWAVCGWHSYSQARTRDVAAQLVGLPRMEPAATDRSTFMRVRPWRQVELPALMRLYARYCDRTPGTIDRTEAYWRWLISCKRFDQIFVAVIGPDRQELDDTRSPIVGYVVSREDQILELVAHAEHDSAGGHLLARACGEAMERDLHTVMFHAPPNEPLHELFRVAGGTQHLHESQQGEVFMVKVLDRLQLLRRLGPLLHERALRASLPRPCELGLALDDEKYRLVVSRRSVKVVPQGLGRSYLRLNDAEFARLLLGHMNAQEAVDAGRVVPATRVAGETAKVLFPRVPLWRSPLDEGV